VYLRGQHGICRVPVRVIRLSQQPNGCWLVGVEFMQGPLTEAEMQALL
jgi:hypothetical protein